MSDFLTILDQDAVGDEVTFNAPTDLIQAERLMAHIKESTDTKKRIEHIVKFVNERAQYLVEKEDTKIAKATGFLRPFVKGIVAANLKDNPKAKKSMDFMLGSAGFRDGRSSITILDEEKALDSCHTLGIETIVKESVSKKAVKGYIDEGHEAPGGTEVDEGEETFTVKVIGG